MLPFYLAICWSRLGRHIVPIHWGHSAMMRSVSKVVSIGSNSRPLKLCLPMLSLVLEGHPRRLLGVAAPQVGLPYRVIAFKDQLPGGASVTRILANPVFRPLGSAIQRGVEECISTPPDVPNIEVERWQEIEVEGFDCLKKRTFKGKFTGPTSAAIQHEIDHLDGVVWPPHTGCIADPW